MGSAYGHIVPPLSHVKLTGINGTTTILCNNSGSVYCESCDDVVIEGITWDRCGNPGGLSHAGLAFNVIGNILLKNCTFQGSQILAVSIMNMSGNVTVDRCNFLSNVNLNNLCYRSLKIGGLSIEKKSQFLKYVHLTISKSNFDYNGYFGEKDIVATHGLSILDEASLTTWNVTISKTNFTRHNCAIKMTINAPNNNVTLIEVMVYNNTGSTDSVFFLETHATYSFVHWSILSSVFTGNRGSLDWFCRSNASVSISNTVFAHNVGFIAINVKEGSLYFKVMDVVISNNVSPASSMFSNGFLSIHLISLQNEFELLYQGPIMLVTMTRVNFTSNSYSLVKGGSLYTESVQGFVVLHDCLFINNTSVRGAAIYVDKLSSKISQNTLIINNTTFDCNFANDSIIYVDTSAVYHREEIYITKSRFTNNVGVCMFLLKCRIILAGDVFFINNTADNGAALYINQENYIVIEHGATLQFVNNSAAFYGGAIFIGLDVYCNHFFAVPFKHFRNNSQISFINNVAGYGGDSIYFSDAKYCNVVVNSSDVRSIMNVPYQFNYSQIINGTLTHIPTDYNYTWLNVTKFPVVTSPHRLILYGDRVTCADKFMNGIICDNNAHYVSNQILGKPINFNGIVLDFFSKPAEETKYRIQCSNCSIMWELTATQIEIDNISPLNVILVGEEVTNRKNVTIKLIPFGTNLAKEETLVVVELVPCPVYPGYYYSDTVKRCVCYHHDIVECYENYNEIKRGYWFGTVNEKATTSLCPNQYCQFDHNRKKTRDGYYMLPNKVNDQCEDHRSGSACGECSPGYTLPYDSTDCISVDKCSVGKTMLVVVLTCLYWIAIVAVTFFLVAYMKFRISSGYAYGIIYYYSMVGILLSNNPYISDGAMIFINILSGFTQLTPRFLGQLCLAQGLSGIDQLFFHYCHAIAVSLFLIAFVLVANCCGKVSNSKYVARYVFPVFSLLLLLSYTSLTSTSLQLLRPLTFTDISGVYTYSSPDIKFFHGRHLFYGVVAIIFEVVIGIGVPAIIVMEPLLRRNFNTVKLQGFLDETGNCYKNKCCWVAAYYLICRHVILLTVVVVAGDNNYDQLQIAFCTVIATIHMWIKPYKSEFLKFFDGFILLLMVAVVSMNASDFLQSVATPVSIVLVVLPLVVCIAVFIKKVIEWRQVRHRRDYNPIDENDDIG